MLWTWIWASSGSWWWAGRPGVLQSMGLQWVRHDWSSELNWVFIIRCNYSGFLLKAWGASWDYLPFVCVLSHFTHIWLFCDPMNCSQPGSSVHGLSQIRILEWIALPSSRESFWPMSLMSAALAGGFLTTNDTREAWSPFYEPWISVSSC